MKYSSSPQDETLKWSYKVGFCVGAGFEFDLAENEKIAIEVDGLILQKKGNKIGSSLASDSKSIYHLNTLCIPALVRTKLKSNLPFYFLGGGQMSYVLSHKFEEKSPARTKEIDLKENTKNFNWGLVFGGGLEIKINKFQKFFIEGRYNLGFMNIMKYNDQGESVNTSTILFILGIKNY